MAEGEIPKSGHALGFLKNSTAGLPNWAWILVVGAGIAAAIVIPKYMNKGPSSPNNPDTGGGPSGLGLAVDPTTGLPYAVEGLVPSGAMAGGGGAPPLPAPTSRTVQSGPSYKTRQPLSYGYGTGVNSIPVRDAPGGNVVGQLGFGEPLNISGPSTSGPNNFGQNSPQGVGSTDWYPLAQGGFVSGFDVQQMQAAGSTGPSWPSFFARGRNPRYVQEVYHVR